MTFGNILTATRMAIPIALLLGLLWFRHDARTAHLAFDRLKAEYIADSQMAALKQIASNQATQARYRQAAEKTNADYQTRLAGAYRASDSFMRTNRACSPGGTATAAQGADTDVPPPTAPAAVLVDPADVTACTDAAVYARSAYGWAQKLIKDGLAE